MKTRLVEIDKNGQRSLLDEVFSRDDVQEVLYRSQRQLMTAQQNELALMRDIDWAQRRIDYLSTLNPVKAVWRQCRVAAGRFGFEQTDERKEILPVPKREAQAAQIVRRKAKRKERKASYSRDLSFAIHVHAYHLIVFDELLSLLGNVEKFFDLYISTSSIEKACYLAHVLKGQQISARTIEIAVVGNEGRDIYPFVLQMKDAAFNYDFICHLHTKRSLHTQMGNDWRKYLYENLIGDPVLVGAIEREFRDDNTLGLVFPQSFPEIRPFMKWQANKDLAEQWLRRLDIDKDIPEDLLFPAGNMFWVRPKAVAEVFETKRYSDMIPPEEGQLDGTVMHAMERLWGFIAENNGYHCAIVAPR